MAAIGDSWGAGTWADDIWGDGTWADSGAGSSITALDDDLTTAFSEFLATLPAGGAGMGYNERIRAFANSEYGTSYTDIQPLIQRILVDIRG